jgi:hypothetical protein
MPIFSAIGTNPIPHAKNTFRRPIRARVIVLHAPNSDDHKAN